MNCLTSLSLLKYKTLSLLGLCSVAAICCAAQQSNISFKKTLINKTFIAEGVAVADVNKDGKPDILAGAYWFQSPQWYSRELAKPGIYDGKSGYSNSFLNFSTDVNQDGWPDLIRVDIPGKPAVWYENNKNDHGYWKEHFLYGAVGNESPMLVDIDGDGLKDLVCNDPQLKQVIWLKAPSKTDTGWQKFVISEGETATNVYTHGLGYGDINKDGRNDIVVKNGWWEGPADVKAGKWVFHPGDISEDCAQMYVLDVDGDGDNDVISSSSHNYGIWWSEQTKDEKGNIVWVHHVIFKEFSQTHNLALADINGDGNPDLVTGKRYFAHLGKDPGEFDPVVLYWFEFKPGKEPQWIPHKIDDDSGAGLNLAVQDMNGDGLPDIVTCNKKGCYLFEQQR